MAPKIRCTNVQKKMLVEYMTTHPDFANGEFGGPLGSAKHEAQWQTVAEWLRSFGPDKPVSSWKTTWRDLRRRARRGNADHQKAAATTGNFLPVPDVTEEDEMILSVIGRESSEGIGPPESGIGGEDAMLPPLTYASPTYTPMTNAPSPPSSPELPVAASSWRSSLAPISLPRSPAACPPRTATCTSASFSRAAAGPARARVTAGPSAAAQAQGTQPRSAPHVATRMPAPSPDGRLPFPAARMPGPVARLSAPGVDGQLPAPAASKPARAPASRLAAPAPAAAARMPARGPVGRARRPRSRPARSDPALFAALQSANNALLQLIHKELVTLNQIKREELEVQRERNHIIAANRAQEADRTVLLDVDGNIDGDIDIEVDSEPPVLPNGEGNWYFPESYDFEAEEEMGD